MVPYFLLERKSKKMNVQKIKRNIVRTLLLTMTISCISGCTKKENTVIEEEGTEISSEEQTGEKRLVKIENIFSTGRLREYQEYEYDEDGYLSKIDYFGGEGDLWKEEEFDQAGNLIHKVQYDENGEIRLDFEYQYDNFGNQIFSKEKNVEEKKMLSWDEWEYDAAGNMLKHFEYDGVGDLDYGEQFKYDANGNLTEEKKLGYDGYVYDWYGYEYDEQNRETKEITYNEDGSIYKWIEKEYDEQGNLVKVTEGDEQKVIYIDEFQYNENGKNTKHYRFIPSNEQQHLIKEWIYDEQGRLLEEIEYLEYLYEEVKAKKVYEYSSTSYPDKRTDYAIITKVRYDKQVHELVPCFLTEWKYDIYGNIIEEKHLSIRDEYKINKWQEYAYDEKGNRLLYIYRNEEGIVEERWDFSYDEYGNRIREIKHGNNEVFKGWQEFTYTEDGIMIKDVFCDEQGNITSGYEYAEHENGKPILIKKYSSDGLWQEKYEYDETGRETKLIKYKGDEMISLVETIYDKRGDITEINKYMESNGKMELDETYIYHYENIR